MDPLTKEQREMMKAQSLKFFGASSFWQTFQKRTGATLEQVCNLFLNLDPIMEKFGKFKEELDQKLVNGDLLYINKETGTVGMQDMKMVNGLMKKGVSYPDSFLVKFLPIPKDGYKGWYLKKIELVYREDKGSSTTEIDVDKTLSLVQDSVD